MIVAIFFWMSLVAIVYAYVGYPFYLLILSKLHIKPIKKQNADPLPCVSVVIAAKNEAQNIERRIHNLLKQNYPPEKLEIIVVSDGSSDSTVSLTQQLEQQEDSREVTIRCIDCPVSKGKPTALNIGIKQASGAIIVFTDARQQFDNDAILELVKNFSDSSIGGVSGELVFIENGESAIEAQMGGYWKYEKWIRKMESATGSVVGATGAIYAIRKNLYQSLPHPTLLDDVMTPMAIVMQGYRIVFDDRAIAYDIVSKDVKQEWHRKVRTLAGNWQLLSLNSNYLIPYRNPLWFRFVSHKLARVCVPFFLIVLFVTGSLKTGLFYCLLTAVQIVFYLTALIAFVVPGARKNSLVQLSYFFCVLNIAAAKGFIVWVTGGCEKVWSAVGGKS